MLNIKKAIEALPLPSTEEMIAQAQKTPLLFPDPAEITPDFIRLSCGYRYLFGRYFILQTGLDKLDARIKNEELLPCPEEKRDFFQTYDSMGLDYFYLRIAARVDRLQDDEKALLEQFLSSEDEASWIEAMNFVAATLSTVMTVNPEQPDVIFRPTVTIFDEYRISGGGIPLVMMTSSEYDGNGNYASEARETRRKKVVGAISAQLADALTRDLGCPVKPVYLSV